MFETARASPAFARFGRRGKRYHGPESESTVNRAP